MDAISVSEILRHQSDAQKVRKEDEGPDAKRVRLGGEEEAGSGVDLLAALEEEEADVGPLDETAVKKLIATFEKRQLKNQEMRIKFPDEPTKFMDSEVELNTGIQELHALAAEPSFYPLLWEGASGNTLSFLLQLVTHDNKDISVAVLDLLQELTDAETMAESGEVEELGKRLVEAQAVALLVQNMERLDDSRKDESDGIHNSLGICENLLELQPEVAAEKALEQGLVTWLLKRVRQKASFDGNKLYASEILAVVLQQSKEARLHLGNKDGIDILLSALASYKRHNPGSADERELMENLFNSLCAALLETPNRAKFLEGEGLQLMNLMLREKAESRDSALKVLNYATTGPEGKACAEKFVEILGLRTLFPLFLKTPARAKRKDKSAEEHEEHVTAVIASLLRNCGDKNRQRVINKFLETDHIKVDRLVELYLGYLEKVREVEKLGREVEEEEEERHMRLLEAGLYTLELLSLVLADLCVSGPSSIRARAAKLMSMKGGSFERAKELLRQYSDFLGEDAKEEKTRVQNLLLKL